MPPIPAFTNDYIQREFDSFCDRNPEVYQKVVALALQLKEMGYQKYSIDAVLHKIRLDTILQGESSGRINNNFTSRFARKVMMEFPALDGFFQTRRLRAG